MYDHIIKLILIGDSECGKSSIFERYINDVFVTNQRITIGLDLQIKTVEINKNNYKIQLWDTAGQEKYRSISISYYKHKDGVLCCFSLSDRESFENLNFWLIEVKKTSVNKYLQIVIIGNKIDLQEQIIKRSEIIDFCKNHHVKYFETSAKTGHNIVESFNYLIKEIVNNWIEPLEVNAIQVEYNDRIKSRSCCNY
jgi:small GTP-binding protein